MKESFIIVIVIIFRIIIIVSIIIIIVTLPFICIHFISTNVSLGEPFPLPQMSGEANYLAQYDRFTHLLQLKAVV